MACELKLAVPSALAGAIIGRGGSTLRDLKASSGVQNIQLSQRPDANERRSVMLTGDAHSVKIAFARVARLLRSEASLASDTPWKVRLIVPRAVVVGSGGERISALRKETAASINIEKPSAEVPASKERMITCEGQLPATEKAVDAIVDLLASREHERHAAFLSQWAFSTAYNDHFETPERAYRDILPLLQVVAKQSATPPAEIDALSLLRVYDPYYCQGRVRTLLSALGCTPERILNCNRDFYADIAQKAIPPHDILMTNPPYSGDHKQRLLDFLCSRTAPVPFLLLLPAWVATTDYWRNFVAQQAAGRQSHWSSQACAALVPPAGKDEARFDVEKLAGVFYLSPTERYHYAHPEFTG